LVVREVGDSDRLVAVGAGSTDADSAGEDAAVGAALFAEETPVAVGAFVDGVFSPGAGGWDLDCGRVVL